MPNDCRIELERVHLTGWPPGPADSDADSDSDIDQSRSGPEVGLDSASEPGPAHVDSQPGPEAEFTGRLGRRARRPAGPEAFWHCDSRPSILRQQVVKMGSVGKGQGSVALLWHCSHKGPSCPSLLFYCPSHLFTATPVLGFSHTIRDTCVLPHRLRCTQVVSEEVDVRRGAEGGRFWREINGGSMGFLREIEWGRD